MRWMSTDAVLSVGKIWYFALFGENILTYVQCGIEERKGKPFPAPVYSDSGFTNSCTKHGTGPNLRDPPLVAKFLNLE